MSVYILDGVPVNVVGKPWWIGWLFSEGSAVTINGTVYINDLGKMCLLNHEFTHVRQQRAYSSMSAWLIKYLTNSNFRNSQELEAYLVQCHEIGIFYGKKSFEYSSFLAELPYLTNNSLTTINSRIADLWMKFPSSYIVEFYKK